MPANKNDLLTERKQAVKVCLKEYKLQANAAIEEILKLDCLTGTPSKKLAFLVMAYKREVTTAQLRQISDQPAGLVKALRADGFLFKDDGRTPPSFVYKNSKGETCRKIIGFRQPKARLKSNIEPILEKSVAACVSAIEVYNKPDFKYREETFSILLVNAWELLLKAKVLADNNGHIKSIHAIDQRTKKAKTNRSGNPMTIDIFGAIKELETSNAIDARCRGNIEMLIEIRDNAIHFVNKGEDLSKKVQEVGIAGLRNYVSAMAEWFGRDLSQYNFYLMPMSFFHSAEMGSFSIRSRDKEIEKMLN
jgi:hypothetical protein